MRGEFRWMVAAMGMACCMSSEGQETDADLVPVHYDVYLKDENPLHPFAVDHPCGAIVTLQANKLPMKLQGVELLWAYELDSTGRTKMKWPLPVDASPLAIQGQWLIIHQFSEDEVVFVTPEGGIGTDPSGPPKAPALASKAENLVECPAGVDEGSLCSKLADTTTGAVRLVAYPPACT